MQERENEKYNRQGEKSKGKMMRAEYLEPPSQWEDKRQVQAKVLGQIGDRERKREREKETDIIVHGSWLNSGVVSGYEKKVANSDFICLWRRNKLYFVFRTLPHLFRYSVFLSSASSFFFFLLFFFPSPDPRSLLAANRQGNNFTSRIPLLWNFKNSSTMLPECKPPGVGPRTSIAIARTEAFMGQ